jgi:GNAT superfamily N-acetyltransferase
MEDLQIVAVPAERLEELQPIWRSLYEHHLALTPYMRERAREPHEAWEMRRQVEREWLEAEPQSFVLAARRNGDYVGYAFVRVRPGAQFATSWRASDPLAELSILAVAPTARGAGVGTVLLDAVEERLAELGVADMTIDVVAGNAGALRLYERRGAVPFVTQLVQRVQVRRAGLEPAPPD